MIATNDLSIVMADGMMSIFAPDNGDYWDAMHRLAGTRWDAGNHCWVAPVDPVAGLVTGSLERDRLRNVQLAGGLGDTLRLHHGDEIFELLQGKSVHSITIDKIWSGAHRE